MFSEFWNKTITIFTPYVNNSEIEWYKYIIENVFIKDLITKNNNNETYYSNTNRTVIRFSCQSYIKYKEWISLSSVEKTNNISVDKESIIVLDTISDENILEKLKYNSGTFLFDNYKCTKPISITENIYPYLPHILIIGD